MPRIAIPVPHSSDREYAERAIPQYERAVEQAGGEPVRIPLDETPENVMKLIATCDAVLLPGSKADVDPAKFHAPRSPRTAPADVPRNTIDELLLEDAYRQRKPILGICYGLQSLNVFRAGSLIQHIPDFLPQDLRQRVNHEAGKMVVVAHMVEIEKDSKLAAIIMNSREGQDRQKRNWVFTPGRGGIAVAVNSSHHQAADSIGNGLRAVARCEDGIIEALEGTSQDHFVTAVQWHPERTVDDDPASRAIFEALIHAASREAGS
jgi:putative glutamine amidotransferase